MSRENEGVDLGAIAIAIAAVDAVAIIGAVVPLYMKTNETSNVDAKLDDQNKIIEVLIKNNKILSDNVRVLKAQQDYLMNIIVELNDRLITKGILNNVEYGTAERVNKQIPVQQKQTNVRFQDSILTEDQPKQNLQTRENISQPNTQEMQSPRIKKKLDISELV